MKIPDHLNGPARIAFAAEFMMKSLCELDVSQEEIIVIMRTLDRTLTEILYTDSDGDQFAARSVVICIEELEKMGL